MQTFVAEKICIWQEAESSPCAIDLYSSPENPKYHKSPAYEESELMLAHGQIKMQESIYTIQIYIHQDCLLFTTLL